MNGYESNKYKKVRKTFLDPDYRKDPKTDFYCVRCQKDIKPGMRFKMVYKLKNEPLIIHPEDAKLCNGIDIEWVQIGLDCAKKVGLEFTQDP